MSVRISHIQIRGEDPYRTHIAGDIIDGYIQFAVLIPCKIYIITVGLYGTGKSRWVVESDRKKHRVKGYEEYNTVYDLIQDGEVVEYPVGKYNVPFRIQLKEMLPQSYEGNYSRIKYVLRAKLKTDGEGVHSSEVTTIKHEHKVKIRVIRDLNKLLDKKGRPIGAKKVKFDSAFIEELGCWFSTLGKIVYQIYCLRQGFVLGEEIEVKIFAMNHTITKSCFLHYAFEQRTMNINDNRALERSMTIIKAIAHMDGDMLLPSQEIEKTIVFKIPQNFPISGCRDSNIVDISYNIKLQFEIFSETSGMKTTKRDIIIPIIIGDKPVDLAIWKHLQNQKKWVTPQKFFAGKRKEWDAYELVRAKRYTRDTLFGRRGIKAALKNDQ